MAILDKQHTVATNRLDGMYLCTLWRIVLPSRLIVLRHLADTILMSHQHVSVRHQHGITDLAASLRIIIPPRHLSVFHDKHAALLAFAGIQKVVARKTPVNGFLRPCRSSFHIFQYDVRTLVGTQQFEFHMVQPQSVHVAGKQSVGRRRSCPARLGIVSALFAVRRRHFLSPTPVLDADVAQRHVADGLARHARHDDACQRVAVVGYHLAD